MYRRLIRTPEREKKEERHPLLAMKNEFHKNALGGREYVAKSRIHYKC